MTTPPTKTQLNAWVQQSLADRVRDAAYYVPGATVSSIVEAALARELRRLAKQLPGGEIPKRPASARRAG